ncbi:hypothetical protein KAZ82_00110 [Candidatus Babeliales bacterium]|nr:hypothetical protein [Candidatus Babeliales bacterium]
MKKYILLIALLKNLNLFAVESRTNEQLANELKNISESQVDFFLNDLSDPEKLECMLYVLYKYEALIIENIIQNPLLWIEWQYDFFLSHDVPVNFIKIIKLAFRCPNQNIRTYWAMIKQKVDKRYLNSQVVTDFLNFARKENINKYCQLLNHEIRQKRQSNFVDFIKGQNIFELLNVILIRNKSETLVDSVVKNPYIIENFIKILLRDYLGRS